jgi:hypothetical protein
MHAKQPITVPAKWIKIAVAIDAKQYENIPSLHFCSCAGHPSGHFRLSREKECHQIRALQLPRF